MRSQQSTSVAKSLLILLGLFALGACASSGEGGAVSGASRVTLIVQNDRTGAGSLTVFAVPDVGGGRVIVGHVGAAKTDTLQFRAAGSTANTYRFVAEGLGAGQITSNSLSVRPGETVRWNLTPNIAYIAE